MSEFTRSAILAAINLAVENYSRTDTTFDEHENEIPHFANLGSTKPKLSLCGGVGVVIHRDRQSRRAADLLGERQIAPVEARDEKLFAFGIDETGETDADAFD